MFKRGELISITVVITLVIVGAFLFLGVKPFENGPTGIVTGPLWTGETTRFVVPMNEQLAINLDDYFTSENQLTYVATKASKIDIEIEGSILILIPEEDFVGERGITIYAYDGGAITRQRLRITVAAEAKEFVPATIEPKKFKVEQEVEQAFQYYNEVDAIIILKEESPFTFTAEAAPQIREQLLEQKKKQVEEAKKALLSKVNEKPPGITGAAATQFDFELVREYETVNALAVKLTKSGLENLRNDPAVEQILIDRPFSTVRAESIPLINADDIWGMDVNGTNYTGIGETVCVIDTGIDLNHPEFTNKIVGGYDFVNNDNISQDDAGNSHGTHVSGIAAGNGTVKGVAPDAQIVPVKVCNSGGSCTGANVLAGIDYCNNNSVLMNISSISGSLGDNGQHNSTTCPTLFFSAFNTSVNLGIIPVFASGNNGYTNGVSYPACSPLTISVGSTSKSDSVDGFSNRGGDRLDIFAPGSSITSSTIGNGTGSLSGTSMATPHIAGAIALLQQSRKLQNKTILSISEMRELLKETGKQVGEWHRVDVYAALIKLEQNYSINVTDNSVTNITPPQAKIKFKNNTDFERFIECSKIRDNFVDIDSVACPEFNKSAHIMIEGLPGNNATPLRNGVPCPAEICQNVTFVNGTLDFDVTGFTNYSGNSTFDTNSVDSCAVINESTSLSANVSSASSCITINSSNLFFNCSGFAINYNSQGLNTTFGIIAENQTNITIQDCLITELNNTGNSGAAISLTVINSTVINSTVSSSSNNSYAIILVNSTGLFEDIILNNPSEWISSENSTASITNITLLQLDGEINFANIEINTSLDVNKASLNIDNNSVFLDSTSLNEFNQTAQITLYNIVFENPEPTVDFDDNNTLITCTDCTEISFINNTFVFNVTHFTEYSSGETPVFNSSNITVIITDSPDPVENNSQLTYTITINSVDNGTAYNVTVNETYPAEVIFDNSSPLSTNNTFLLGDLTSGTTFVINITVNVTNVTNGTIIDNIINITFQNETGFTARIDAVVNTTVENITITPAPPAPSPPPSSAGSGSGGGGGSGSSKDKKKSTPSLPPPQPVLPTVIPRSPKISQKEVPAIVESPAEVEEVEFEAAEETLIPEVEVKNTEQFWTSLAYLLAMLATLTLGAYWYAIHHKRKQR